MTSRRLNPPVSPAVTAAVLITLVQLVQDRASWLGGPPSEVIGVIAMWFLALWLIAAVAIRVAASYGLVLLWFLSVLWLIVNIWTGTWPWTLSPRTGLYLLESFSLWSQLAFPLLLVAIVYGHESTRRGIITSAAFTATWLGLWLFAHRFAYAPDVGMIQERWTITAGAFAWLAAVAWPLLVGAVLSSFQFRLSAPGNPERLTA